MNIGAKIKKARAEAGLTQKELALKSGVATVTVQQYEREVRTPRIEQLSKIVEALGKTLPEFLEIPDWPEEKRSLGVASELAHGKVNGIPNPQLAKELLDELDDVMSLGDIQIEINYLLEIQNRVNSALNLLNVDGLYKAAKLIEDLTKKPEYQRNIDREDSGDEESYAEFARQQRILEKKQDAQAQSAKESDAG